MKERILFISRKWPPSVGGMETYASELSAGLSDVFDLRLLVLRGREDGRPPALWAYAAFVIKAMAFCLFRGRCYDRVIFGDLILFPAALCHYLTNKRATRLVILYGLDLVYHRRKGVLPRLYGLFFRLFRASQSCFSACVAISAHTSALAAAERIRNVNVITPSLPASSFPSEDVASERLPDVWNKSKDCFRILYFGRLVPRKGSLWFATNVVPRISGGACFFVVGDTSDSEYKLKLRACERTHCLGRLDAPALASMIRSADAVVMPNIPTPDAVDAEGFGLVAIEASSLGARLLASRLDGITDAVIDGKTGLLLQAGNADAWVSAIEGLRDPARGVLEDRGAIARHTRERFSRSAQTSAFVTLLEDAR